MKRQRKILIIISVIGLLIGFGICLAVWVELLAPKPQAFTPHYLAYQGSDSRIYAVSQTISYGYIDHAYTALDGQTVAAGSGMFTLNLTLRNDYSSDNPAPNNGTPISPIDGTAYIRLKATLYNNDATVQTINVTPSDFIVPAEQTGLVLASGQTISVRLLYATNQTSITGYILTLESVGDSIQS